MSDKKKIFQHVQAYLFFIFLFLALEKRFKPGEDHMFLHHSHGSKLSASKAPWMCMIISQLANIYTLTPSFVACSDWQWQFPDWLVSVRTLWDGFVWLDALKHREHDYKLHCLYLTSQWIRLCIIPLLFFNKFFHTMAVKKGWVTRSEVSIKRSSYQKTQKNSPYSRPFKIHV